VNRVDASHAGAHSGQFAVEHSHDFGGHIMKAHPLTLPIAVTAAICFAASAGHAQVKVTTSGGEITTLSQKNVVDHMIVADSLEVEEAQLAMTRTQNAAVKDFANMLVTDHKSHLDNLRKLAGKSDIGREANPGDSSAAIAAAGFGQLQSMSADAGFDKAFVDAQIQAHTREIATLKALRAAAKDDDLQKDIDATLPVLDRHLARAKTVSAQLAAPPTAPMKPPTDAANAASKPMSDSAAAKKPTPIPPKPPTI
jgi:putative membrane protein